MSHFGGEVDAMREDMIAAGPELGERPDRSGRAPGTGRDEQRSDESSPTLLRLVGGKPA